MASNVSCPYCSLEIRRHIENLILHGRPNNLTADQKKSTEKITINAFDKLQRLIEVLLN